MAKTVLKTTLKILIVILTYILQIYVANCTVFFGVRGDLCLMIVSVIALMEKKHVAYISAVLCGVASDLLFHTIVCKYLVIYLIVVSVLLGLKKMYKQDSKLAIIVFSVAGVVISEMLMYLFYLIGTGELANIFTFILNIFKQCVINICLAFLIYIPFKSLMGKGE